MDDSQAQGLAQRPDEHWWFAEREAVLGRAVAKLASRRPPRGSLALRVGARGAKPQALAGNGWRAIVIESDIDIARDSTSLVVNADARALPIASALSDVVVMCDVLERVEQDNLAASELYRVLRPGGNALIWVPAGPRLWSSHDEALGRVRRYSRRSLRTLLEQSGLVVDQIKSWNVLLRPAVRFRRRRRQGSDFEQLPHGLNKTLATIAATERYVPLGWLPGTSLLAHAHRGGEIAA